MSEANKISPGTITLSESRKQAFRLCMEDTVRGISFKLLPDSFYCFRAEDCGTVTKDSTAEEEFDAAEQEISSKVLMGLIDDPLREKRLKLSLQLRIEKAFCRLITEDLQRYRLILDRSTEYARDIRRQEKLAREDFRIYNKNKFILSEQERIALGKGLVKSVCEAEGTDAEAAVGTYKGFDITVSRRKSTEGLCIRISRPGGGSYSCISEKEPDAADCMDSADRLLDSLGSRADNFEHLATSFEKRAEHAERELSKGNPFIKSVAELRKNLSEINDQIKANSEN